MTWLLLMLALDVAWQGVRAIAWHGWAAVELMAALGVIAVIAGALSDTAKAYDTEKRVNAITGRHSSHVQVGTWNVTSAVAGQISGTLTIPAGGLTAGAEYEIYVEGEGKWGGTGNRHNLELWIQLGTQQLALSTVDGVAFNFDDVVAFWMRGTLSVESVAGPPPPSGPSPRAASGMTAATGTTPGRCSVTAARRKTSPPPPPTP